MSDPSTPQPTSPPPGFVQPAEPPHVLPTDREVELEAELARLRELLAAQSARTSDVDDEPIDLPAVEVGDWVRIWYQDSQEGPPTVVEAVGQVLRVVELSSGPAVVVAWAGSGGVSAPIPLDWRLHGRARVDAPHVELVGTT